MNDLEEFVKMRKEYGERAKILTMAAMGHEYSLYSNEEKKHRFEKAEIQRRINADFFIWRLHGRDQNR